jgi:signal transduction histidine kinase
MATCCTPCAASGIACVRRVKVVGAAVFRTAAFRLALLQALLFAAFAVVLLGLVWQGVNDYAEAQLHDAVKAEMASLLQAAGDGTLTAQLQQRMAVMPVGPNYYVLSDSRGQRLLGNLTYQPSQPGWHTVALHGALGEDSADADSVRLLATRLTDGRWLVAGSDNRSIIELGEVLGERFLDIGGITILLVLVSGGLVSRRYLKRIDALGERAERILEGEQGLVISSSGRGDEFDRLAARLNRLIARMHGLMDGLRQVANDIAHDLRTPLTHLRQRLEAGLDEAPDPAPLRDTVEQAVIEVDRLLATFRAMLRIASVEARQRQGGFEELDLTLLFVDIADIYRPVAEERGQQLQAAIEAGHHLRGDRALLAQMLANLIENALHHTPPGTCIQLGLKSSHQRLTGYIADNGPGIPAEARTRVLGRFVRLDSSRATPGDGLGLALVAAVADLHDIKLLLADAEPGLLVQLEFARDADQGPVDRRANPTPVIERAAVNTSAPNRRNCGAPA